MNTYKVQPYSLDVIWDNVPVAPISVRQWGKVNEDITANAQVLWDENALYIHLYAKEKKIRRKEKGLLGSPCEDSCLEFFFSPMEDDSRYFNIEMNPNGCLYLGLGSSIENLVRLIPEDLNILNYRIVMTEGGWEVFYTVPASFVRRFFPEFKLEQGKKIRANFYKCGDKTKKEHYLSWNEIGGQKMSFHQPEYFGELELV